MNKQLSLLLHSVLIVGALLPFSPIVPALQSQNGGFAVLQETTEGTGPIAFGSGAPGFRAGGGTR